MSSGTQQGQQGNQVVPEGTLHEQQQNQVVPEGTLYTRQYLCGAVDGPPTFILTHGGLKVRISALRPLQTAPLDHLEVRHAWGPPSL